MPSSAMFLDASGLLRGLDRMREEIPIELEAALRAECEAIRADSDENNVPVDFGTLRASSSIVEPQWDGPELTAGVAYGGAASEYALAVHEHPSEFDPPSWAGKGTLSKTESKPYVPTEGMVTFHPDGRGPKFLERAMTKAADGMMDRLAERIRRLTS